MTLPRGAGQSGARTKRPVHQPGGHFFGDRPELGVALGLAAVAVVREVADEDLPVADGHRKRSLTNLVEPGVEVLLLQAEGSLPVSVPAAVVVPRVEIRFCARRDNR